MLVELTLLGLLHAAPMPAQEAMAENEARIEANPALLGSDPQDPRFHARLTLAHADLPMQDWRTFSPHGRMLLRGKPDEILERQDFIDALWSLDDRPVSVRSGFGLALWQGCWGASASLEAHPGLRLDHGVALPSVAVWDSTGIHVRAALAQEFGAWRLGTGLHLRRQSGSVLTAELSDPEEARRRIRSLKDSIASHLQDGGRWSAGVDLGALRTLPSDLQVGASLGGVGMVDRHGSLERPALGIALAWIPASFRQETAWDRRLAAGIGLRDLLDPDIPALGHLDMGAAVRQNLSKSALEIRSTAGLRGGWPCAGLGLSLGILRLDGAVWVEDLDKVLGRTPLQHWDVRLQLGI